MKFLAFIVAFFLSQLAFAKGPYPHHDALSHEVDGRWVPVDEDEVITQNKSENALELLEMIKKGDIPLNVDVTQWEPPAPTTVAEAVWHLRNNARAATIPYVVGDVTAWDVTNPKNVQDAIDRLAYHAKHELASENVAYLPSDVVSWGLDNPRTSQEAIDILVDEIRELRLRIEELENP